MTQPTETNADRNAKLDGQLQTTIFRNSDATTLTATNIGSGGGIRVGHDTADTENAGIDTGNTFVSDTASAWDNAGTTDASAARAPATAAGAATTAAGTTTAVDAAATATITTTTTTDMADRSV